jgi:hypothetical protein
MRSRILTGSALGLALIAFGSTQAAACDDDCDRCDGYGYYAAPAYYAAPVYYRPAYAYAPVYYAAPVYSYYAPRTYYPGPAYYAPRGYGYPYGRPYYLGRGGYVDAGHAVRQKGYAAPAGVAARSTYAGAKAGKGASKAVASGFAPRPLPVVAAPAVKIKSSFPAAGNATRYTPTAYQGAQGAYGPPRR